MDCGHSWLMSEASEKCTCPNCKAAGMFLDKAGFKYEKLNANENAELVREFGITQAPTLVRISDGKVEKFANLSNIRAFTERA